MGEVPTDKQCREAVVLRVIEENGQDYAVIHVDDLRRIQDPLSHAAATPAPEAYGLVREALEFYASCELAAKVRIQREAGNAYLHQDNGQKAKEALAALPALSQHPVDVERIRQLLAENRDTLRTARQYMAVSSSSGEYAYQQVDRQIQACQLAIDALPTAPKQEG